jgi:hypothetical protein
MPETATEWEKEMNRLREQNRRMRAAIRRARNECKSANYYFVDKRDFLAALRLRP